MGKGTQYEYDAMGNMTERTTLVDTIKYGYDDYGRLSDFYDKNGNHTQYVYDLAGRLKKRINPLLQEYSYVRDGNGNVKRSNDYKGREVNKAYDALNRQLTVERSGDTTKYEYNEKRLRKVTDPKGYERQYEYDSRNLITRKIDPMQEDEEFSYDANGNITIRKDKNNNEYLMEYDSLNRLVLTTDPYGFMTRSIYDNEGNLKKIMDLNGTLEMDYDALSRLVKKSAFGIEANYEYDFNSNRTAQIDPLAQRTENEYDLFTNRLLSSTFIPSGDSVKFEYDKNGALLKSIDEEDYETTYTYDSLGRKLTVTNAELETTTIEYDDDNNKVKITPPNGNEITKTYDEFDRLSMVEDQLGTISKYEYDANGNITARINALDDTIKVAYDQNNRTIWVSRPNGLKEYYEYDATFNKVKLTDRNGNEYRSAYDSLNRILYTVNPMGDTIKYKYSTQQNLESITDEKGNVTTYEYSPGFGRTKVIYPDGSYIKNVSDAVGRIDSIVTSGDMWADFTYNSKQQVSSVKYPNETNTYTYKKNGWLLTANNSVADLGFDYDMVGRTIKESMTMPGFSTHEVITTYDVQNMLNSTTYPSAVSFDYKFDQRNRLQRIEEGGSELASWTYGPTDLPDAKVYKYLGASISTTDYDFSDYSELETLSHTYNSDSFGYNYTFDSIGNKLQEELVHQPNYSSSYTYDDRSQLNKVGTGPINGVQSILDYGYDNAQNLVTITENLGTTTNTVNNVNQYTNTGFDYDGDGNMISTGVDSFLYDDNRMATYFDGSVYTSYSYDALGRRVEKDVNGTKTRYLYSGGHVVEELDGADNLQRSFVYGSGVDEVLMMREGGNDYYYLDNSIGTITGLLDNTGSLVEQYLYDSYGVPTIYDAGLTPISASAYNNPYLFTGRRYDNESGLYYYRNRYYNPVLCRFMQRDPLGYKDGMNLYAYVSNNPVRYIDPLGTEEDEKCWGIDPNFRILPTFGEVIIERTLDKKNEIKMCLAWDCPAPSSGSSSDPENSEPYKCDQPLVECSFKGGKPKNHPNPNHSIDQTTGDTGREPGVIWGTNPPIIKYETKCSVSEEIRSEESTVPENCREVVYFIFATGRDPDAKALNAIFNWGTTSASIITGGATGTAISILATAADLELDENLDAYRQYIATVCCNCEKKGDGQYECIPEVTPPNMTKEFDGDKLKWGEPTPAEKDKYRKKGETNKRRSINSRIRMGAF